MDAFTKIANPIRTREEEARDAMYKAEFGSAPSLGGLLSNLKSGAAGTETYIPRNAIGSAGAVVKPGVAGKGPSLALTMGKDPLGKKRLPTEKTGLATGTGEQGEPVYTNESLGMMTSQSPRKSFADDFLL